MSITAIVENDTIKLPPGVHVPDGTTARIFLEDAAGRVRAETADFERWLAASTGLAKGLLTTDERMRETRGED